MVYQADIIQQSLKHVWHPCANMKKLAKTPPLLVHEARGSYLYTNQGPVIDAIASWWCKSLGHRHPVITAALQDQLLRFEHVMTGNTTSSHMVELAEMLTNITGKQHVMFASDGSSAIEIALKLAYYASQLQGYRQRTHFISLQHGYHGETLGAQSVSDMALYKTPSAHMELPCHRIQDIPYVASSKDTLFYTCDDVWPRIAAQLDHFKQNSCAILVEPIIQGVGGMRCYSADFLQKLADWASQNNIYFITDEIMTGCGRSGQWLAAQHAKAVSPDIICLGKGLTSGTIPMSCVMIDHAIFDLFYHDNPGPNFLHSHTHSGNALGVRAALATLQVMQAENILEKSTALGKQMAKYMHEIAGLTHQLDNIRQMGAVVAAELRVTTAIPNPGLQVQQHALQRGALLRPLGNTLYWLPPLNSDDKIIASLADITLESIKAAYGI